MRIAATAVLLALATCVPAVADTGAATETVQLDSARCEAEFRIKVLWLFRIEGRFGKVAGTVTIDRERDEGRVDATIDASSVDMDDRVYTGWVKSPEFFDVAQFPEIHFRSGAFPLRRIETGGDLPGTLTVRGIERTVSFRLDPAACPHPAYDCAVTAKATIRRTDFGMHSRLGTLSDKVGLALRIYAVPAATRLAP